jgi:transcriptional antiterminator NusG
MSETVDLKKWYVVRAVSGQENKIRDYMESEINRLGFNNLVEDILVPTQKVVQIRKGKKINKEKVYFPGYIMIKANLAGEIPHIIKALPNVIGFLGETKGGDPIPVRTAEVNRMLGKVDELSTESESVSIPFEIGESIKVIDGPFNGFNGSIEKVNQEKKKARSYGENFWKKNSSRTFLHAS